MSRWSNSTAGGFNHSVPAVLGYVAKMIPSGVGLYYPYTHFRSQGWLKMAALYYDEIFRIIPDQQLMLNDSEDVRALIDAGILDRKDPSGTAEDVAEDFVEYAYTYLFDKKHRDSLFPELAGSGPGFRIHPGKMAEKVRHALIDLNMAELPEHGDDFDLDAVTGGVYMAFLARKMSAKYGIPLVTHDPVFQKLIYKPIAPVREDATSASDSSFALASLVIEGAVPEDPASIPIDSILKFRAKHSAQRMAFYDEVVKLTSAIDLSENEVAIKKNLKSKEASILKKVNNLEKAFADVRIATVRNLFLASTPTWATAKWALNLDHGPIVLGSTIAAALLSLVSGLRDIERQKRESPWSYVLSLRKLHRRQVEAAFS